MACVLVVRRRIYLFSRCPNCIQAEAPETAAEIVSRQDEVAEPPDDGVGIEGGTLALLSDVAGAVVLSSEMLVSWAAGYLAAPTPSTVETGSGWLSARVWNPSPTFKLKIPTRKAKRSWCSWTVALKGLVVPGHQPAPMPVGGSSEFIKLSWAKVSSTLSVSKYGPAEVPKGSRLHSVG